MPASAPPTSFVDRLKALVKCGVACQLVEGHRRLGPHIADCVGQLRRIAAAAALLVAHLGGDYSLLVLVGPVPCPSRLARYVSARSWSYLAISRAARAAHAA